MSQIDSYLSACQLGITMASIGLGFVGEPALGHLIEGWLGDSSARRIDVRSRSRIAFTIITVLHIVIGELAPKSVAIAKPEADGALAVRSAVASSSASSQPGDHRAQRRGQPAGRTVRDPAGSARWSWAPPARTCARWSNTAARTPTLDPGEAHMLSGVFELHENEARNVMTPIPAVVTIDVDDTVEVALRRCTSSGHTRLPVTEDRSTDKIKGVLHLSSLVRLMLSKGEDATIGKAVQGRVCRARDQAAGRPAGRPSARAHVDGGRGRRVRPHGRNRHGRGHRRRSRR